MHFAEAYFIAGNLFSCIDGGGWRSADGRFDGGRAECAARSGEPWSERKHQHQRHEHFSADNHAGTIDTINPFHRDADNPSSDFAGHSQ